MTKVVFDGQSCSSPSETVGCETMPSEPLLFFFRRVLNIYDSDIASVLKIGGKPAPWIRIKEMWWKHHYASDSCKSPCTNLVCLQMKKHKT